MSRRGRLAALALAAVLSLAPALGAAAPAAAAGGTRYVPVNGAGSTWSQNAFAQWQRAEAARGIVLNYAGTGSTDGRQEFIAGLTDFALTEIPFQRHPAGGSAPEDPTRGYAYVPVVGGGTALMYHLTSGGRRITNLRLSSKTIAEIFTGVITRWDDPQIRADNPGITLPDELITPVVRADPAGTTAQFTAWLAAAQTALWQSYCDKTGLAEPCGAVQSYPITPGIRAQAGSLGVSQYVAQSYGEGSIGYVQASYAQLAGYPVAAVLNAAGYYVAPTAGAVAVALGKDRIDDSRASPGYLTGQLSGVYADPDPRAYPISSYSYLIVPTTTADGFTRAKGATLAAFFGYALCQGQASVAALGYSPLPAGLVRAGLAQLQRIPGARRDAVSLAGCGNPAYSASGADALAAAAPPPRACARQGPRQCGASGTAAPPAARPAAPRARSAAGSTAAASGPAAPQPVTLTVPATRGWTRSQTTMALVLGLLLAALLGPLAVAAARRRRRRGSPVTTGNPLR